MKNKMFIFSLVMLVILSSYSLGNGSSCVLGQYSSDTTANNSISDYFFFNITTNYSVYLVNEVTYNISGTNYKYDDNTLGSYISSFFYFFNYTSGYHIGGTFLNNDGIYHDSYFNAILNNSNKFSVTLYNESGYSCSLDDIYFTIQGENPPISIQNPTTTQYNTVNISLNYIINVLNRDKCWYILNGGSNVNLANCENTTLLGVQGLNNLTVYINDTSGNQNSLFVNFTVDTITITLNSPTNNTVNVSNATFSICYYAENNSLVSLSLFEISGNNLSVPFGYTETSLGYPSQCFTFTLHKNGAWFDYNSTFEWFVNITDTHKSEISDIYYFSTITQEITPQILVQSPIVRYYNSNNISLNYTVYDSNLDKCWYILNGGSNVNLANCVNTTFLGVEGLNNLTVYINDTSGNQNSSFVNFTIDTIKPITQFSGTILPVLSYTNETSVTISGNCSDLNFKNMSIIFYRYNDLTTINYSTSNNMTVTYTDLLDRSYFFNVTCYDLAGNSNTTDTRRIIVDTLKDTILFYNSTETNGSYISRNNIVISGATIGTNFGNLTFNLYNSTGQLINSSITTSPATFTVNYTNLANGTYYFNATVRDLAGNYNTSETRTVTIDTTNPVINFNSQTTSSGNYMQTYIIANISVSDLNLKNYTIYLYNSTGLYSTNTTSTFVNFTNLPLGQYYLNATIYDLADNNNQTETRSILLQNITLPSVDSLSFLTNTSYYNTRYDISYTASNYQSIKTRWYVNSAEKTNIENLTFITNTSGNYFPTDNISITLSAINESYSDSKTISFIVPYENLIYYPKEVSRIGIPNINLTGYIRISHNVTQNSTYNFSYQSNHENITIDFLYDNIILIGQEIDYNDYNIIIGNVAEGTYQANITITRLEDNAVYSISTPINITVSNNAGIISIINAKSMDWYAVYSGSTITKQWQVTNIGNRILENCTLSIIDIQENPSTKISFDLNLFSVSVGTPVTVTASFNDGLNNLVYRGYPTVTCIATSDGKLDIYDTTQPEIVITSVIPAEQTGGVSGGGAVGGTEFVFLNANATKEFRIKTTLGREGYDCIGLPNQTFEQACGKKLLFQIQNLVDEEMIIDLTCGEKFNTNNICNWFTTIPSRLTLQPKETVYFEVQGMIPSNALIGNYTFTIRGYRQGKTDEYQSATNVMHVSNGGLIETILIRGGELWLGIWKFVWFFLLIAILSIIVALIEKYSKYKESVPNTYIRIFTYVLLYIVSIWLFIAIMY